MLKIIAVIFGLVLLVIGVLGFIPGIAPNGMLLGIFMVDTVHNIIHIASGILALLAATSTQYASLYFKVFGVIYGAVTILGFALHGDMMVTNFNNADNGLHLVIALIALYLGFFYKTPIINET